MPQSNQIERPHQNQTSKLKNLRRLAFFLDNSIPIPFTQYRMGLDPILGVLGIVGGTGDLLGGVLGAYIVTQAARLGVPQKIVWRMMGNLFIDSLVGLVPGLGDILDIAWKANARNVALLDQYFETSPTPRKNHPLFIFGVVSLLVLMIVAFAWIMVAIIRAIIS